jgi:hypothetical protein
MFFQLDLVKGEIPPILKCSIYVTGKGQLTYSRSFNTDSRISLP